MISVVVPCYNCEKTLDRCIQSIRNQTKVNLEIVLVNDGSKDSTGEMCDKVATIDSRIKVVHQANRGLMNAWKQGVWEATGEYIAFCDADDYVESNLIEILEEKVEEYHMDMLLYDMKIEYENGAVSYLRNRLEGGFYTREDIDNRILPWFFFQGDMQSEIMLFSRCAKVFRRELLIRNLQYLNDEISTGEDDLTTFATVLSADSVYCMKGFYPYHYMRNNDSMIGKYDAKMFRKLLALREELHKIADVYHYRYVDQIEQHFMSNIFLCIKKEICRNRKACYCHIRENLQEMRENETVSAAIRKCSVKQYSLMSKIFARLVINKRYFLLYSLTLLADALGKGVA